MLTLGAILILCRPPALAKAARMPLAWKVAHSAVIVRVKIKETRTPFFRTGRYRSIASAEVVTLLKGSVSGRSLKFDFDNGLGCPNVLYRSGEECIVFLGRQRNGRLETVNSYYGKLFVDGDTVKRWHLPGYQSRDTPFAVAAAQIRKLAAERQR